MKKIYYAFLIITILSIIGIIYIQYDKNTFYNNPLPNNTKFKIEKEVLKIRRIIFNKYGEKVNFPIEISEKLPNNLYGMATMNDKGKIIIYLNKNRFKESEGYMYGVLAHEYAHAMMFHFGYLTKENSGHTKKWQQICYDIGGTTCERFVDRHDILIEKVRF
ncbi:MAG: SprT protein [Arcobacteraceae bacterium]|jgi:SprT protein